MVVELRYSTARGTITKAARTSADGVVSNAAAVGKFGTVLRWLAEPE
ncbi:hypothetical protein [Nocardia blacklockiae]|nr:hypothetical protein [Nocardia blacklockiae]MBF6176001.1 hypothetical protein [Nocardia blacklockiae]